MYKRQGLACICTSLIALVATIARQIRNIFSPTEREFWPIMVLVMGSICAVWGIILILATINPANGTTGYIMIGLGLVCYSTVSYTHLDVYKRQGNTVVTSQHFLKFISGRRTD